MRTERELAHVLGHERELELSSHFRSRDEMNAERVQILASDSERELAHIFHELLMLCGNRCNQPDCNAGFARFHDRFR